MPQAIQTCIVSSSSCTSSRICFLATGRRMNAQSMTFYSPTFPPAPEAVYSGGNISTPKARSLLSTSLTCSPVGFDDQRSQSRATQRYSDDPDTRRGTHVGLVAEPACSAAPTLRAQYYLCRRGYWARDDSQRQRDLHIPRFGPGCDEHHHIFR